jgi:hypothetical protein
MSVFYSAPIAALALAVAGPAPAQPAPGPAAAVKVDPARRAAARELLQVMRIETTLEALFQQLAPAMGMSMVGLMAGDPDAKPFLDRLASEGKGGQNRLIQLLAEESLASMKTRMPRIIDEIATSYAALVSEEDLRAGIAFYTSPSGSRLLAVEPQLQAETSKATGKIGEEAGREAVQRAFDRLMQELQGDKPHPGT